MPIETKKSIRFIPLFLFIFIAILYSPTLNYNFAWDDNDFIVRNQPVHSLSNMREFFTNPKTFVANPDAPVAAIRPFRNILYAVQYAAFNLDPRCYHLITVFFYAINGVVLYQLLRKIVNRLKDVNISSETSLPFWLAVPVLLWAVHPVNTEIGAWVKSQDDIIALLFGLWSMHLTLDLMRNTFSWIRACFAGVLVLCSCLTKEIGIVFPVFSALILFFILMEQNSNLGSWQGVKESGKKLFSSRKIIAALFLQFVIAFVYLIYRHTVIGRTSQTGYLGGNFSNTMATMMTAGIRYLQLLVWPFPPTVQVADYEGYPIYSWKSVRVWVSLIGLLAISSSCFYIAWKKRAWMSLAGLLVFFVGMFPVSNVIPMMQIIAERFLYIPMIGLVIASIPIFRYFSALKGKNQFRIAAGCLIAVLICSVTSLYRMPVWANDFALMEATTKVNPDSMRPKYNYAYQLYLDGETTKSFTLSKELFLKFPQDSYVAQLFADNAYNKNKKIQEPILILRTHLEITSTPLNIHNLARYEAENKNIPEAIQLIEELIRKDPDKVENYLLVAKMYYDNNEKDKAVSALNQALSIDSALYEASKFKAKILTEDQEDSGK